MHFPSMPLRETNYVRMTIGNILPENGRTREVKILVSNLKYVKRITRQQAHVVAQKEKERRKNKNKNGVSGSRTVNESDSSDSSDSSDDGFDMTDSSDEECDEKFI